MVVKTQSPCESIVLGTMEYTRALAFQKDILFAKLDNRQIQDYLLFVEHFPVFTLGRRGGKENLAVSESFLATKGIDLVQTDRGGNITYHGPGQAVLYPVIDLEKRKLSVPDFVSGMEEVMKQTCLNFNILADRNKRNHGVWVGDKKIGSVGLSIKKGISIHGLALNINPDLDPFSWINPCGLANLSMTSIAKEANLSELALGNAPNKKDAALMKGIAICFFKYFAQIFNMDINETGTIHDPENPIKK